MPGGGGSGLLNREVVPVLVLGKLEVAVMAGAAPMALEDKGMAGVLNRAQAGYW